MLSKILIANRGEIACRVIRTSRRMGIATVAVYSEADAGAQHVQLADEAWPIGGPRPQDSYLRGEAIIAAALASGAQGIHPGYGFLSENADFADAVEAAGMVFIGPKADSMRRMGSKAGAKELMAAAGVPVVPGYTGEDQAPGLLQREADRIGYPLMIKAAYGGGGKGMRIVRAADGFLPALESCQREARNAFGRDRVLLERYIESPRHIEIQVFADAQGNTIHLNERECSAQRRYQKVLEEAPSPFLTPQLRARMGEAAVLAARAIGYQNAGTVEFIVAPSGDFFFMEINTRLQVEHPVTEMVTGLDLVEWQLRVASGEPLPLAQADVPQRGHAIEVRLYAEDPDAGFLPGSGRLQRLRLPADADGVRIDSGVVEGDVVTIFYDPMIAKLIVHADDRAAALARLRSALAACVIEGPKSNIAFLERLARHPAVVEGRIDTGYLDRHLDEFIGDDGAPAEGADDARAAAVVATLLGTEAEARCAAAGSSDPGSPWGSADGWRLGHAGLRRVVLGEGDTRQVAVAHGAGGDYRIAFADAAPLRVEGARLASGTLHARFNGRGLRYALDTDGTAVRLHDGRRHWRFERVGAYEPARSEGAGGGNRVAAPMPGRIVVTRVQAGERVSEGQELLVMEAMKMELALKAPRDGVVGEVLAREGDFVDADAVLVTLED
ncbi:acetyl/propionyl/methylcrotonyl-CoA carboxylase subunit alpha [Luteimonas sp. MC1750]|uniref:acetyl/propionyl/methylcrotonyl-CoA carboxylase subunit alpha n=1 Tax=Luteimonas sp. MC1750 TaxID=2799326 RepID=UPI0018F0A480|nr:acetyl/propionyl/methylcrotonyl-CoA carboxylase subunit alpha [Luteimonas sp. MC1750]MBJ6984313.1 acetyl/propionyl/methylcrotonyl-CoA carboxylase subunit alpha [Luteimonas sp. MC1750]QQO05064.1 acetyl/propionyl/methylcrotonyl-CoA carboxylase subunit alpha [Luteimonas sp. MC1750]